MTITNEPIMTEEMNQVKTKHKRILAKLSDMYEDAINELKLSREKLAGNPGQHEASEKPTQSEKLLQTLFKLTSNMLKIIRMEERIYKLPAATFSKNELKILEQQTLGIQAAA